MGAGACVRACSSSQVSFFRPNLRFSVRDKDRRDPLAGLLQLVGEQQERAEQAHRAKGGRGPCPPPSGIVYCLSRDESEQVAM